MRVAIGVLVGALLLRCSESDSGSPDASGGDAGAGGSSTSGGAAGTDAGSESNGGSAGSHAGGGTAGGAVAGSPAGGAGETAGGGGASAGEAGQAGDGGAGGERNPQGEAVPLPAGSREFNGIVNLVDAAAAAELEQVLTAQTSVFITLRHDLTKGVNLFLKHYQESYDFVLLFTDHAISGSGLEGVFEPITRKAMPGGTSEFEIAASDYTTTGRTKGVIALQYNVGVFPPIAHEIAHYWAVDLDSRFGFGLGLGVNYGQHWGFAGVAGQLGGFDAATLKCQTPAGASPPACTALASGRTRYVVGTFAPQSNVFLGIPYSPLELYLMGLGTAAEVPASFPMLTDGQVVAGSENQTTKTLVVEGASLTTLKFSDITARHGTVTRLPAAARNFSAAFVVLTTKPASDAVMTEISRWAAIFGARETAAGLPSFAAHTGNRATLETRLGARRTVAEAVPAPRAPLTCSALTQNCPRPELGCYVYPPAFCALSGGIKLDQPCNAAFACAPGLDCVAGASTPTSYVCKPYCDPINTTAANACQKLCPSTYLTFKDTAGASLGGLCTPP